MKNKKIKTGKLQMKALLLAGVLVFESVFAGIGPVNAQTVSENEIVSVEDTMSKSATLSQKNREINTEEVTPQGESDQAPEIVHSGTDGGVKWSIDENGLLLLTGDGDYEGDPNWLDYSSQITSAIVKVKNMTSTYNMFFKCENLISLTMDDFDTSKVTNMSCMFNGCSSLTSLNLSNFNTSNVGKMDLMFCRCTSLMTLDLSSFNTSKVKDMQGMFSECTGLKSLNLSSFITDNVTQMQYMFLDCTSLESLDLSNFNTSSVTEMWWMFCGCKSLTSLDVSSFDTGNVTSISGMFEVCSSLTDLDLSNFNTSKLTSMNAMFYGCSNLTSLDLSSFDTSNVSFMDYMFEECSSLINLNLSSFITDNVTQMQSMFAGCKSLTSLDLSSWDLSSLRHCAGMLDGMDALIRISLPQSPVEIVLPGDFYAGENGTYTLKAYADSYCGKNGHTYSSPIFTWADDYSSATLYMECAREDCAYDIDDKYVQMDAVVTKEVIYSITEKEEATVYTATAVHKGKTYTDVKSVKIPKLPQQPTQPQNPEQSQQPTAKPVGTSVKTTTTFFRVTKAGKTPELAYMGPKNKKVKKVTIPATVKIDGVTYKVTSVATGALKNYKKLTTVTIGKNVTKIGKNAFYGCKKLGKIVIKTKKLKTVGKNAFKGIKKNATIDVPNSKKKAYKKLLKAKTGYKKTMKIK